MAEALRTVFINLDEAEEQAGCLGVPLVEEAESCLHP